jgi:hypothetical protein
MIFLGNNESKPTTMKQKTIHDYLLWALISACLLTLGMMVYACRGHFDWFIIAVAPWSISPYLLLLAYVLKMRSPLRKRSVITIGTFIVIFFGLVVLFDGLFIHLDSLNGLLFLFMPPYQLFGALITIGISYWKEY